MCGLPRIFSDPALKIAIVVGLRDKATIAEDDPVNEINNVALDHMAPMESPGG